MPKAHIQEGTFYNLILTVLELHFSKFLAHIRGLFPSYAECLPCFPLLYLGLFFLSFPENKWFLP